LNRISCSHKQYAKFPKVFWKCSADSGQPIKIKIEINTFERIPVMPLTTIKHIIDVDFYSSSAHVKTFQVDELIATKIRALYQRSKGRDLFDIWLALNILLLDPAAVISAFDRYRPEGFTSELAISNLVTKLTNKSFIEDLFGLAILCEIDYIPTQAGDVIIEKLLKLL